LLNGIPIGVAKTIHATGLKYSNAFTLRSLSMTKSKDQKKEDKKKPSKTLKEKRMAKQEKKKGKSF
jgi:hypothetical protein